MNRHRGLPHSAFEKRHAKQESQGFLPRGYIDGLTIANDTTDATNDVVINPGVARSTCRIVDGTPSTATRDQMDLELPVGIIKQLDVVFAPENYDPSIDPAQGSGDRSGGRSSSSLANGSWHVFFVGCRGVQPDVMLHDSVTQSSVLAEMQKAGGYTAYRRIGSIIRSTSIRAFTQLADEFLLKTPVGDYSVSDPGTSAVLRALTVPDGIEVSALHSVKVFDSTPSGSDGFVLITSPAQDDTEPTSGLHDIRLMGLSGPRAGEVRVGRGIRTNTSRQIRIRQTVSNADIVLIGTTHGWIDTRDK